ncbi:hypothetical protein ACHAWF_000109 [Thalassiosira exigua]
MCPRAALNQTYPGRPRPPRRYRHDARLQRQ